MAGTEYQHNSSGPGDQFIAAGPQNNNSGSGTQYNAHNINFNAPQDSDASLLADLRITDPRDDKDRIEHTKGGLFRDSYRWILENSDFQEWRNGSERRLLWVRGDPGKGKTMLLCGLINELTNEGTEPVYFFCQATDSRLNTATAVLRGLIYLLLEKRPSLIQYVREKHRQGGKRFFEDANSWIALGKILAQMLSQQDQGMEKIVLVIDALDECTTRLDDLLDMVIRLSSTPTKVVVSSRNWSNIQEAMATAERQCPICLELNEASVSAAVLAYTNYKVSQLVLQKGYNTMLRDAVQSYLTSYSNGTFLWVSIVAQRLGDLPIRYPCVNWAQHLSQGLPPTTQEFDEVHAFLTEHYLHWLEAISFMQSMGDGMACIHELKRLILNSGESSPLANLVKDAFRFFKQFYHHQKSVPA
ncbi:hypothetical protein CGMCC3_g10035 [Colletotrichum fructicola]|nr:uncharacterized protein CGMCC3_g10035 [Colletotrichum fructicola]KAE9574175.1 hypothetical protein CGMCC3_g10035 [Colletotrichum fructicola]